MHTQLAPCLSNHASCAAVPSGAERSDVCARNMCSWPARLKTPGVTSRLVTKYTAPEALNRVSSGHVSKRYFSPDLPLKITVPILMLPPGAIRARRPCYAHCGRFTGLTGFKQKSFTAKGAKDAKEGKSFTTKDTKEYFQKTKSQFLRRVAFDLRKDNLRDLSVLRGEAVGL